MSHQCSLSELNENLVPFTARQIKSSLIWCAEDVRNPGELQMPAVILSILTVRLLPKCSMQSAMVAVVFSVMEVVHVVGLMVTTRLKE
ncbi:putative microcin H47 biosynthesis protein [Escherichia coli]|uniref:Putative microcin H47 biosynthesis protein n=1 Tax=Escherichia coli TaxID=562 RepID=A0A3S4LE06_ECOLX|nr:putative microcin H47 biosynthesis protein [Escherichia coli]